MALPQLKKLRKVALRFNRVQDEGALALAESHPNPAAALLPLQPYPYPYP